MFVTPNRNCRHCKHFLMVDEPGWNIDNFHFYCNAERIINGDNDREPICIDNYSQNTNQRCITYEKREG